MTALDDIAAERARQISDEGWTPAHDDAHDKGEMAGAAASSRGVASNRTAIQAPPMRASNTPSPRAVLERMP